MPAPVPARSVVPARQPSVRGHNLALVLRAVADGGPASRAQIATATGLTKASVSSLVETLTQGGLLVETGRTRAAVGRPGTAIAVSALGPQGIGLEINVDYVACCTVDLTGAVRHRDVLAEDLRGVPVADVFDRAAALVRRAVDGITSPGARVAGLAVAVPGLVETGRHRLLLAPNLGWSDVAVLDELDRRMTTPDGPGICPFRVGEVRLDNEANLAALGELWCGGHRDSDGSAPLDTFVHVSGEIGVGAGIVLHGNLLRGRRGLAGEIGHVPVGGTASQPGATLCRCGATGCLESVAGQEAILRAAGLQGPGRSTGRAWGGPLAELVTRAQAGERRAHEAIGAAGTALGVGLATVANLVDVDTVVLGGVYARLAPWLRAPVEQELAGRVLGARTHPVRVLVSALGAEAAVRGAATSVVRRVIDDPARWLAS